MLTKVLWLTGRQFMTGVKADLDPRGPVPREQQICRGQQPLEQVKIKAYCVDTQQPRRTNFGRRLGKGRFRKKGLHP